MNDVKASDFARAVGISRYTIRDICRNDPELAYKKGRDYFLKLDILAQKPGMDIVETLIALSGTQKWIKVVDFARLSGIPRRTLAYWCKTRPTFGKRVGRVWYMSVDSLNVTPEQAEFLAKWAPNAKTACAITHSVGELSNLVNGEV